MMIVSPPPSISSSEYFRENPNPCLECEINEYGIDVDSIPSVSPATVLICGIHGARGSQRGGIGYVRQLSAFDGSVAFESECSWDRYSDPGSIAPTAAVQITNEEFVVSDPKGYLRLRLGEELGRWSDDGIRHVRLPDTHVATRHDHMRLAYDRRYGFLGLVTGKFHTTHTIRLTSLFSKTGKIMQVFEGHTGRIYALDIVPTLPGVLFSVSWDLSIRKWDYSRSSCVSSARGHAGGFVLGLAHSIEYNVVASSGNDRSIVLWDPNGLTEVDRVSGLDAGVSCLCGISHTHQLVAGTLGAHCSVFDFRRLSKPVADWVLKDDSQLAPKMILSICSLVDPDYLLFATTASCYAYDLKGNMIWIRRNEPRIMAVSPFRVLEGMSRVETRLEFERIEFVSFSEFLWVTRLLIIDETSLTLWKSVLEPTTEGLPWA